MLKTKQADLAVEYTAKSVLGLKQADLAFEYSSRSALRIRTRISTQNQHPESA